MLTRVLELDSVDILGNDAAIARVCAEGGGQSGDTTPVTVGTLDQDGGTLHIMLTVAHFIIPVPRKGDYPLGQFRGYEERNGIMGH
jgi:hypothetical protein